MSKHHVTTTINGEPMEFLCEAQQTLLDVLRDELGLTGSKEGCGSGDCGACTVISDGKLVCSCLMLGVEAEGKTVTTVEGIAEGDKLHPVQQKFLEHAALQCGFCTPGFIVAAKALLDENKNPTEEETRYWLAGNLCRCTGYDKIIRAVLDAAAVMPRADFLDVPPERAHIGAAPHNLRDLSLNCMAKGKVLYEGHAVAAVAATSPAIAEQALDLIEVDYEVLPHVMDVEAAMAPDAPLLHDNVFTAGIEPKPTKPSNITKMVRFAKGDVEAGFKEADIIIERRYTTKPVHQGYIEPHACLVSVAADGQCTIFSSSQGQFMVRAYTSRICGADIASIRAIPAEIGGGFGGKTIIYLEPLAYMLSKKSGRPVKMVMSREEVFRATGPTSGAVVEVKLGAKKDGHITAARTVLKYQAGAVPGSPVQQGCICGLAVYDLPNAETIGYDVLCNRAKVAAYRAPGAPIGSFAVESCVDELAHELKIDPLKLREINGAQEGTKPTHGPTWVNIGYQKTLEAAKASEHLKTPLGPNQGPGIASGYWHNAGGESSAACHVNEDGTVTVTEGHPDIGGSRASMAMMVAEVLGIPFERVRPVVGDTTAIGFSASTGGSRVTFAGGMAVTQAAEKVVGELKKRAAVIWDISPEAVEWKDGKVYPAGPNAGSFEPLDIATIGNRAARTGRPIP